MLLDSRLGYFVLSKKWSYIHRQINDALPDDIIRVGDEIISGMGGRFFVTRIFESGWGAEYIGFSEDGKETFRSNSNNGLKKTGRHTDDVRKLDIMAWDTNNKHIK